ncbi:MAG: polysaccharide biosynthesis protein [Clostridia bacterium]|nr:polysaccharide biosynthesis protein [Clostridia bacterium]
MDFKNIRFKKALMIVYDILFINVAYIISFLLEKANVDIAHYAIRCIPLTIVFLILYWAFGIYKSMWEYAGAKEMVNISVATVLGGLISISIDIVMSYLDIGAVDRGFFSATFYFYGTLMALLFVCAMRVGYRSVRRTVNGFNIFNHKKTERVMIVGAGDMGMIIIKELESGNYCKGKPVVAVDDNPLKLGQSIRGVPVKGNCNDIPTLAEKYRIDTIIICIPSASDERQAEILHIAVSTGRHLKISPSLLEMVEDNSSGVRDVNITDLLSRPEVKLDTKICSYLTGKNILVTGGGGSIGSELCRQISKYSPSKIIIFDIYENNAFVLKNQLDRYYGGDPEVVIRIGSVRDEKRLREIFDEFHPQVVFHAAAHKHVPLMEDNPGEAVKNNVFGTYNLAKTAVEYGVERFVSISTDKAVNPTNVMGATKRVTEMIIQHFERECKNSTKFAAVRFGNVLGSSGSVIPLFTEQIKNGGPVTVTHPDITRYFMTIPEASQLVVQAGGMAEGGEVFVLDMGEPVKILTLAENLIVLSGHKPYVDIDIIFSGLRPGEKLYEELALEEEYDKRRLTANNKIYVTSPIEIDDDLFVTQLEALKTADAEGIRKLLKLIVPNFHEPEEANAI